MRLVNAMRVAATRPLVEDDCRSKMAGDGCGAEHVRDTIRYIQIIADNCGFKMLTEIDPDAVYRFIADCRRAGKSTRRINALVTAVKGFTRWMTRERKVSGDPLARIKLGNAKRDRRYECRPMTLAEFDWLNRVTRCGPERFGMTGVERAVLYCVAIQTGLRSGECRNLVKAACRLEGEQPSILCRASITKNAKDAYQHPRPETAAELRALLATKAPAAPVFNLPREDAVIVMLHADLRDARQAWIGEVRHDPAEQAKRLESDFLAAVDSVGHRLDFHALRYTTGAWLAMAGVHPKRIQRVMRHSTITLTMDTYAHLFPAEEAGTVNFFPDMSVEEPEPKKATGTCGPALAGDVLASCLALQGSPRGDSGGLPWTTSR